MLDCVGLSKVSISLFRYVFGCSYHATHILFIAEVTHIDIHSRTSLVRLGIVNQEHLELIRQPNLG